MVFLSILRKSQRKEKQIRVLLLGLDNAGKSTLVASAMNQNLNDVHPTLGFAIETLQRNGYTMHIWDVGGQRSLRPFWQNYFEKTDFLIWVVDATAIDRLNDCREELHSIMTADKLRGAGLLIWVNKIDLVSDAEEVINQISQELQLDKLKMHNYELLGCSAYTGYGVEAGLDYLLQEVANRLFRFG